MKILVLNSGSSSLKYRLIEMDDEKLITRGVCEKIGEEESTLRQFVPSENTWIENKIKNVKNHTDAFGYIRLALTDKTYNFVESFDEISAVGHRVVHGGEMFSHPVLINDDVIEKIRSLIPLAPLHNPAHLAGILACRALLGDKIPQVAVFDSSFYSDIPKKAYMFAIPCKYYEKYGIRKYGFHGTSHKYVSDRYKSITGNKNSRIISCHLGNGSSVTAINGGKVIDTSMGLTPLGGLMMGTRSGSLDPSVIIQMAKCENLSIDDLNNILNKESGMLGISGIQTGDDRKILESEKNGNTYAKLAHQMMVYQISKFISSYFVPLNGCDTIIFTGGIGENQWIHRENICKNLEFAGVIIDKELNKTTVHGVESIISSKKSKIQVWVIPTNEELEIAKETKELLFCDN